MHALILQQPEALSLTLYLSLSLSLSPSICTCYASPQFLRQSPPANVSPAEALWPVDGVHSLPHATNVRRPQLRRTGHAGNAWRTSYARVCARRTVSAVAVTPSTRPPLATSCPAQSMLVPAWKTWAPGSVRHRPACAKRLNSAALAAARLGPADRIQVADPGALCIGTRVAPGRHHDGQRWL